MVYSRRLFRKDFALVSAAALALSILQSCASPPDVDSVEGLTLTVKGQQTQERNWEDVSFRKLYELPVEADILLLRPLAFRFGDNGHVLVMDYGDMKVKRFGPDGKHVATYGTGIGAGPGDLSNMTDTGTIGDSIVYVVDDQLRRIVFFASDGRIIDHASPSGYVHRHLVTPGGRSYSMVFTSERMVFETRHGVDAAKFGDSLLIGQEHSHPFLLDGFIDTHGEQILFAPLYFPVVIRYDEAGSIVYARTTIDIGRAFPPRMEREDIDGYASYKMVAKQLHHGPVVDGDKVYFHTRLDSTAIDIYDAKTGDYQSSISLPFRGLSLMMEGRIYHRRDTTIAVYAVQR